MCDMCICVCVCWGDKKSPTGSQKDLAEREDRTTLPPNPSFPNDCIAGWISRGRCVPGLCEDVCFLTVGSVFSCFTTLCFSSLSVLFPRACFILFHVPHPSLLQTLNRLAGSSVLVPALETDHSSPEMTVSLLSHRVPVASVNSEFSSATLPCKVRME